MDDTIAAIATPPGEGGIAVVRISGLNAIDAAETCFRGQSKLAELETHRAIHGWVVDGDDPVDEVVATLFRAPRSMTGEDVVEIACHGGVFVSRRILEVILTCGVRPALPGEFTQRAFLNGKLDLSQAEAVADLIRAKTEAARRVAARQLKGGLSDRIAGVRKRLVEACSLLEIEMDFGEEDVTFASREELRDLLSATQQMMTDLLATFDRGRVCREGVRTVIVGRPNVGKSSLLNALVERERAIVTDVPGTTRDTVDVPLDIGGLLFTVTDTAGLRPSDDPVELEGIRRTEAALAEAELILLVMDGSQTLSEEDVDLVSRIQNLDTRIIPVINKVDLSQCMDLDQISQWFPESNKQAISALHGTGIPDLLYAMEQTVLAKGLPQTDEIVLTRQRHADCLERARCDLSQAETSLKEGMSQEFVAVDLRGALDALGAITGETTTDEILDRIFSEFCIGK